MTIKQVDFQHDFAVWLHIEAIDHPVEMDGGTNGWASSCDGLGEHPCHQIDRHQCRAPVRTCMSYICSPAGVTNDSSHGSLVSLRHINHRIEMGQRMCPIG
jgi:hypothetical protein